MRIHPAMSRFMYFVDTNVVYEFTSLPFGLNAAPLVFTSVLRQVVLLLRSQDVNILAYLDDFVVWAPTQSACAAAVLTTCAALQSHGFLLHPHKSQPQPTQSLPWLGFVWDTRTHTVTLAPKNAEKIVG